MESDPSGRNKISFVVLQARLIRFVNLRIENGDFTERGLARILGISQSQTHNVLKGARKLKPELADHLMSRLDIRLMDLLESSELADAAFLRRQKWFEPGVQVATAGLYDSPVTGKTPRRRSS